MTSPVVSSGVVVTPAATGTRYAGAAVRNPSPLSSSRDSSASTLGRHPFGRRVACLIRLLPKSPPFIMTFTPL